MPLAKADHVQETTTTDGTVAEGGYYDLDGAVSGFRTVLQEVGNGVTAIFSVFSGSTYEIFKGTYESAGNRVQKNTLRSSSNADANVDWGTGGTQNVTVVVDSTAIRSLFDPDNQATGLLVRTGADLYAGGKQIIAKTGGTGIVEVTNGDGTAGDDIEIDVPDALDKTGDTATGVITFNDDIVANDVVQLAHTHTRISGFDGGTPDLHKIRYTADETELIAQWERVAPNDFKFYVQRVGAMREVVTERILPITGLTENYLPYVNNLGRYSTKRVGIYDHVSVTNVSGSPSNVDITIPSTYDEFLLRIRGWKPTTTSHILWLRISENGVDYLASGHYRYFVQNEHGGGQSNLSDGNANQNQIALVTAVGNGTGEGGDWDLRIWPQRAFRFSIQGSYWKTTNTWVTTEGAGGIRPAVSTARATNLRFLLSSSGTHSAGSFHLYGLNR